MSIVLFVLKSKNIFNKLVLYMACFLGWLKETCNFCGSWQVIKNKTKTKKTKNIFRKAFKNINNTKLTTEADKSQKKRTGFEFVFHSALSKKWFALEYKWLKTHFDTREKNVYNMLFQIYIPGEGE